MSIIRDFLLIHDFSLRQEFPGPDVEIFEQEDDYLGLHFIETGKIPTYFGKILDKMFDERDVVDYRIFEPVLPEIVATRIEDARNFIVVAKSYLAGEEDMPV